MINGGSAANDNRGGTSSKGGPGARKDDCDFKIGLNNIISSTIAIAIEQHLLSSSAPPSTAVDGRRLFIARRFRLDPVPGPPPSPDNDGARPPAGARPENVSSDAALVRNDRDANLPPRPAGPVPKTEREESARDRRGRGDGPH